MNQNWIQYLGLILIVGFSVISWLYRKFNEEAAKKRARDAIEERRREMLRTGRDPAGTFVALPDAAEPEMTSRQREVASRREAQLAELRRRAALRQQRTDARGEDLPPPHTPPTISSIPGSAGPTVPQRRSPVPQARQPMPGGPGPMPRPQQRPQQRPPFPPPRSPQQRPQRQQQGGQQGGQQAAKPARTPLRAVDFEEERTNRLVQDQPARVDAPIRVLAPQTPEEWRKAIIANEILSPPVAVRTGVVPVPF